MPGISYQKQEARAPKNAASGGSKIGGSKFVRFGPNLANENNYDNYRFARVSCLPKGSV
jgi:hypothetical protein